jgi:hypothetical protein
MVGTIARVKIKMVISLVKLSFLFNSEITVFHRYLYNKGCFLYNNLQPSIRLIFPPTGHELHSINERCRYPPLCVVGIKHHLVH